MKEKEHRIVLLLVSIFVFMLAIVYVFLGKHSLDNFVSDSISKIWNQPMNSFFIFLGEYSKIIIVGIAIAFIIFLYFQKRKRQSLIFAFTLIIGYLLKNLIKLIVQRERPLFQLFQETGYGFPSGHAIFSVILFSMIIYFYKDEIKNNAKKIIFISAGIFIIFLIGFSRIYLNVHWLSDVIGGYALGFFLTNLGLLFLKKKKSRLFFPTTNSKKKNDYILTKDL